MHRTKASAPGNIRTFLVLSSDYGEPNHKMNTDRTESNIHDSYRGVVLTLLTTAALGTMTALVGGLLLANPVILAVAITLGLESGALLGVLNVQRARNKPPQVQAEPALADESDGSDRPRKSDRSCGCTSAL
jgi:hypothetical protein